MKSFLRITFNIIINMKKFILLSFILTSFAFANAQEVAAIYFNNQGTPVNLDGAKFNGMPKDTKVNFPIIIIYQNTGEDLNAGDSLYLKLKINDQELGTLSLFFNSTLAKDSVSGVNLPIQLSTTLFNEGDNLLCAELPRAVRSGVAEDIYEDEYCATFEINFASNITENALAKLNVYPNPAKDFVNIENANNATISIYNMMGQLVRKVESTSDVLQINTSDFNSGIYMIKIQNGESIQTKKIQVNK